MIPVIAALMLVGSIGAVSYKEPVEQHTKVKVEIRPAVEVETIEPAQPSPAPEAHREKSQRIKRVVNGQIQVYEYYNADTDSEELETQTQSAEL